MSADNHGVYLTLTDLRRPLNCERSWHPPFEDRESFTRHWWLKNVVLDTTWFVRVTDETGNEVARVEMDEKHLDTSPWTGAPLLGPELLEIQLFEVCKQRRLDGVGKQVIRQLENRHPHRRLVALSKDADSDKFWTKVGYRSYPKCDGKSRSLFVQPEHD